jgi:hypothetical protein
MKLINLRVVEENFAPPSFEELHGNDVRGQSLSSMGESFFFPLYQARKYVLTSWYCNSVRGL